MLNNVDNTNGLYSLTDDASASSVPLEQNISNNDYRKIKNMMMSCTLNDISSNKLGKTFDTSLELSNTDIILKGDGSVEKYNVQASHITPITNCSFINNITNNVNHIGTIRSAHGGETLSTNHIAQVYEIFNPGYTGNKVYLGNKDLCRFQIELNEPKIVNQIYLKFDKTLSFKILGSTDGVNFDELYVGSAIDEIITIASPNSYRFYELAITMSSYYFYAFNLLIDGYNVNIPDTTITDIQNVYILPSINFNSEPLIVPKMDDIFLKDDHCLVYYDDIVIEPCREIITNVTFNSINNHILEFTKYIYYLDLINGSEIHTSNILPSNDVSFGGTNSLTAGDAYLAFDGDNISSAFTETTDETGIVDIEHIYKFDTPTTIYKLQSHYGLATSAPKKYKVYGSFDGISYVELLDVVQYIAIDDYISTKSFEIDTYDNYSYYKIHITEGNISSNVSINQYTLLKESLVDEF